MNLTTQAPPGVLPHLRLDEMLAELQGRARAAA